MRFVVGLSVVLGLVFLSVAGALAYLVMRSAERLEQMGDEAMAVGQYDRARELYGKSFRKDTANTRPLEKFCDAIRAWTPPTEVEYLDAYIKLMAGVDELAASKRTDVAAWEAFFTFLYDQHVRSGYNRRSADTIIERSTLAMSNFENDPGADASWERLKRYRGLATLDILENEPDTLVEAQLERGEADLVEAIAANPADDEVGAALARWHVVLAQGARTRGRAEEEQQRLDQARRVISEFVARDPESARMALAEIQLDLEIAVRGIPTGLPPLEQARRRSEAAAPIKPAFEQLVAMLGRIELNRVDARVYQSVAALEQMFDGQDFVTTRALLNRALAQRPDEPELRNLSARLATIAGDYEGAVAEYEAIAAQELPPVSLRGAVLMSLKTEAAYRQAELAVTMWDRETDPQAKAAALARAESLRDQLSSRVGESSAQRKLIDAKIAYARANYVDAQRLLIDYNNMTGTHDSDAVRLLARVEQVLNRPGQALEMYRRLTELQPGDVSGWMMLGDMLLLLQRPNDALSAFQNALILDPQNADARQRLNLVMGLDNPELIDDKVAQAILIAGKRAEGDAANPPDTRGAIAVLQTAIDTLPADPRLYHAMIAMHISDENLEGAKRWADAAVAALPDNEEIKRLRDGVGAYGSVDAQLALIDQAQASEIDKLTAKARLLMQTGDRERAMEYVRQASAINPEEPYVVDVMFSVMIEEKNFAEARRLLDVAVRHNIDRVNGMTFQARLQAAEGAIPEAIATLRNATLLGTATSETWRLLGAFQLIQGNAPEAVEAYERAMSLKPTDVPTIVARLQALVQLGRIDEALRIARENESIGRDDRMFSELLLLLEQERGDRQKVVARREAIRERRPEDKENLFRLAQAYISVGVWDKSRAILDELRRDSTDLEVVTWDVGWYADQGKFEEAEQALRRALDERKTAGQPVTTAYYFRAANLMVERNELARALALLDQARAIQDPTKLEVDREIGVMLFSLRQFEQCIEPLKRFLAVGDDPNFEARSRVVEALAFLGRYDEAERILNEGGEAANREMPMVLLRASIAQGRNDRAGVRRVLDDAVTRFPSSPLPYVKRAEHLRREPGMQQDALADCNTAIRLAPNSWHAYQVRALVHNDLGETSKALDDLRQAVRLNSDLDGARDILLRGLVQMGRAADAAAVAKEAADQRPGDLSIQIHFGDFFWSFGLISEASTFYQRAWEISKNNHVAQRYALALLRLPQPDLRLADQVLMDPALTVTEVPELLMTRAMLRQRQGRAGQARQDAIAACRLVMDNPQTLGFLMERLVEVFQNPVAVTDFARQLDMSTLPDQWANFLRARFQLMDPNAAASALEQIRVVSETSQDMTLKLLAIRLLASNLIQQKKYAEAVEVGKRGLEIDPENFELNNNIAYLLATELDRVEEALPYAERAAKGSPQNAVVLDTLGLVLYKLGRLEEAAELFNRALTLTAPPEAHISAALHLALVQVKQQDRQPAQMSFDTAVALLDRHAQFKPMYETRVAEVRQAIAELR